MKVVIDDLVYRQVMYHVDRAGNDEVSGFGSVVIDKEAGVFRVVSAMVLKQKNSSAATELDAQAMANAMGRHLMSGLRVSFNGGGIPT